MRILALALLMLSPNAHALDYGVYAGSHIGIGDEGRNGADTFPNRTVGVLDLQALPGARFYGKALTAGLLFDFRLYTQVSNADPVKVGNYGGTGLQLGPGVALDLPFVRGLLAWDIRARQSINDPDQTFKGSGFHFLLGYKAMPTFSVDFEYVSTRYKTVGSALEEIDLSDLPVTYHMYGLGASIVF